MANRTLYVGPRTEEVWVRAQAYADEHEISLSTAVTRALKLMLDGTPPPEPNDDRRAVSQAIRELSSRVAALETVAN